MSLSTRLAELNEKHRSLEKKIAEEHSRPSGDPSKIMRWKHEKLKLKEEIVRLEVGTRQRPGCRDGTRVVR